MVTSHGHVSPRQPYMDTTVNSSTVVARLVVRSSHITFVTLLSQPATVVTPCHHHVSPRLYVLQSDVCRIGFINSTRVDIDMQPALSRENSVPPALQLNRKLSLTFDNHSGLSQRGPYSLMFITDLLYLLQRLRTQLSDVTCLTFTPNHPVAWSCSVDRDETTQDSGLHGAHKNTATTSNRSDCRRRLEMGQGKSGVLDNKSGNISETRKDRGKVTMDGLQKLTHALSNGTIHNPLWPPLPQDWGLQLSYPSYLRNR